MQPLPYCAPLDGVACRLSYAVEIRPKGFLPVGLIQSRIASDLSTNLAAIRDFVEAEELLAKVKRKTIMTAGNSLYGVSYVADNAGEAAGGG